MRRRATGWILLSVCVLAFFAYGVGVYSERRALSAGYFFPQWGWGGSSPEVDERNAHWAELTNVADRVAILLKVVERRPSRLGGRWRELLNKLPSQVSGRLPEYLGSRTDEASFRLSELADSPAVATAVGERWGKWSVEMQTTWLRSQDFTKVRNRPEYLPLLRSSVRSSDNKFSSYAALLLASYRPVSEPDADLLAAWMTNRATGGWYDRMICERLAEGKALPSPLVSALSQWLNQGDPQTSVYAALVLALVAPKEFPGEQTLPARLKALSPDAGVVLLRQFREQVFRPVVASAWSLRFWSDNLREVSAGTAQRVFPAEAVLEMLGGLGPSAAPAAPDIASFLTSTNRSLVQAATRALVGIAPPTPDFVLRLSAKLTEREVAAGVLLWLTAAGTNALPARTLVAKIAQDEIRYPKLGLAIDPALASKYGLNPGLERKGAEDFSRPSTIFVGPYGLSPSLLAWWPSQRTVELKSVREAATSERAVKFSQFEMTLTEMWLRSKTSDREVELDRFERVSLAELAQHCLGRMESAEGPDSKK